MKIIRGESVKAIKDYDLFDNNVNGMVGVYLKTDERSGKHLVYFQQVGEWAELTSDSIEQLAPGNISGENQEFISRIKEMEITLVT